jgi:hypothetical protein
MPNKNNKISKPVFIDSKYNFEKENDENEVGEMEIEVIKEKHVNEDVEIRKELEINTDKIDKIGIQSKAHMEIEQKI